MISDKKFIWGLGLPDSALYALYLPVKDRFIAVHHDKGIIQELRNLLSSKCNTILIDISLSPEYYHKIIDNHVCENWTIENRNKIDFACDVGESKILDGSELGLRERPAQIDDDVIKFKKFVQLALQILSALQRLDYRYPESVHENLFDYQTSLFFTSQTVLPYHDDDTVKTIRSSIASRTADLKKFCDDIIEKYKNAIYWAKDETELQKLWDDSPTFFFD